VTQDVEYFLTALEVLSIMIPTILIVGAIFFGIRYGLRRRQRAQRRARRNARREARRIARQNAPRTSEVNSSTQWEKTVIKRHRVAAGLSPHRIVVDKRVQRIRFEDETEEQVIIVIEEKPLIIEEPTDDGQMIEEQVNAKQASEEQTSF